jgi:DNA-binding response OmpR family regulator
MSKRILLIDDEKDIVQIMRKKIQAAGFQVSVAYNGRDGLEITSSEHPHLILTDVVMPVMDGFAFYHELKNRQDVSHIPVIVATAHGGTEETFRALGVKDFLTKPFDTQVLLDKVNHFFLQTKAVKVVMATKMLFLMKNILSETLGAAQKIDLHMTNDHSTIVDEAVALKPDLIILDVDMFIVPSAHEVVRLLREHVELKETTILLTRSMLGDLAALAGSRHPDKSVEDCLARGASHFIGSLNKNSFTTILQEYCR